MCLLTAKHFKLQYQQYYPLSHNPVRTHNPPGNQWRALLVLLLCFRCFSAHSKPWPLRWVCSSTLGTQFYLRRNKKRTLHHWNVLRMNPFNSHTQSLKFFYIFFLISGPFVLFYLRGRWRLGDCSSSLSINVHLVQLKVLPSCPCWCVVVSHLLCDLLPYGGC